MRDSDYALGVEAFADGDFERAANLWLADAYKGSADAQFNVGVLYIEGKGVSIDRGEALFWFEKAAVQGHPEAQYNLGHLLLEEKGDVERIREGIEWWRKSAEQGFAIAQYNYGRAVFYGIGVDQNRPAAKAWIEKAAIAGNKRAQVFIDEQKDNFVDQPVAESAKQPIVLDAATPAIEQAPPSEELVERSEYVLVGENPVLMYSRFNAFSPVVTRIDARVLLRVVDSARDWLRVEVPGGVPGWVKRDQLKINKDLVEITSDGAKVRADPTESTANNDIGELALGAKALLLEEQARWVRVLLPEKIPGWIEELGVKTVNAESSEIARVWQTQRVRLKIDALASREISIASEEQSSISAIDSTDENISDIDLNSESVLATVAKVEPLVSDKLLQENAIVEKTIGLQDIASEEIELPAQRVVIDTAESIPPEVSEAAEQVANAAEVIAEANEVQSGKVLEAGVIGGQSASDSVVIAVENAVESEGDKTEVQTEVIDIVSELDKSIVVVENVSATTEDSESNNNPNPGKAQEPDIAIAIPSSSNDDDQENDDDEGAEIVANIAGFESTNQSTIQLTSRSGVAVRTGASVSLPAITTLPLNSLVDVVGEENGFAEVIIPGGLPVWIRRSEALVQGGEKALIKGSRVRALSTPPGSAETRILGLLPAGEVVRIVNERGDAIRVVAPESITAWVSLKDLKQAENIQDENAVWQEQSYSLLTNYLDAELQELAVVPTLGDNQLVGTGIPNDNNWLFEDSSKGYTLQLFSMQNQSSARSQFRSLNGRGQLFSTRVRGERWYFVLLGKFLTPESAEAVAEKLPRWASGWRVRSLQRLQVNRCKKLEQFNEQEAFGLAAKCS
ncbi:MAG: SEL1-like repeat protein [Acidiferrobacterales bacterium]|nr:SEL1-like repeat protein [Acidiferrobacterales bacterium]